MIPSASVASPIRCRRLRAAIGAQRKAHRLPIPSCIGKRCNAAMLCDRQRRPTDDRGRDTRPCIASPGRLATRPIPAPMARTGTPPAPPCPVRAGPSPPITIHDRPAAGLPPAHPPPPPPPTGRLGACEGPTRHDTAADRAALSRLCRVLGIPPMKTLSVVASSTCNRLHSLLKWIHLI